MFQSSRYEASEFVAGVHRDIARQPCVANLTEWTLSRPC